MFPDMTEETTYQPMPTLHGRVRPSPPPIRVEEGSLPPELKERINARQGHAEVLLLPREVQDADIDPTSVYTGFDEVEVTVLRRAGISVDFLADEPQVVHEFSRAIWIDFAIATAASIHADTVIGIARYLIARVRHTLRSQDTPQLDLILAKPDGTFIRATGSDTEAVLKAYFAGLASTDEATRDTLLRLLADEHGSLPNLPNETDEEAP
jgi:hypothetical protein